MADIMDKIIHVWMGMEKKAREAFEELESEGRVEEHIDDAKTKPKNTEEVSGDLTGRKKFENKVVETGLNVGKEVVTTIKDGKDRIEEELVDVFQVVSDKLGLVNKDDLDTAIEMARLAREKNAELEKRIEVLEKKG